MNDLTLLSAKTIETYILRGMRLSQSRHQQLQGRDNETLVQSSGRKLEMHRRPLKLLTLYMCFKFGGQNLNLGFLKCCKSIKIAIERCVGFLFHLQLKFHQNKTDVIDSVHWNASEDTVGGHTVGG
jgi:hypothetical protein